MYTCTRSDTPLLVFPPDAEEFVLPLLVSISPILLSVMASLVARSFMTPIVWPVVPPAVKARDGEEQSTETAREPEVIVIVPPLLIVSFTSTEAPDVTPVAVSAVPLIPQTCVSVALLAILHLTPRVITVPFGITSVLSKVNVVSEPLVARLDGTLLPVLSAVEPL